MDTLEITKLASNKLQQLSDFNNFAQLGPSNSIEHVSQILLYTTQNDDDNHVMNEVKAKQLVEVIRKHEFSILCRGGGGGRAILWCKRLFHMLILLKQAVLILMLF